MLVQTTAGVCELSAKKSDFFLSLLDVPVNPCSKFFVLFDHPAKLGLRNTETIPSPSVSQPYSGNDLLY
jgi:hypothetical protein